MTGDELESEGGIIAGPSSPEHSMGGVDGGAVINEGEGERGVRISSFRGVRRVAEGKYLP